MKHPKIRTLIAFLTLLLVSQAQAQINIEITGGTQAALPIAIVPFQLRQGPAPATDAAEVIGSDLRRSGMFELIPSADFLAHPSRFEDVQFQNWRALGADNLVIGSIERLSNGQYELRVELLDVYKSARLFGKRYRVREEALRTLAHNISDLIYEEVTGQPGAFNTQIAYVGVSQKNGEPQYHLMLADADGARPQVILNSPQPLMSPTWSPDRKQLAYVSFEDRRSAIYVQTVATGERRRVASFPGINGAPAWSPDGRRLALTLSKDGNADIYVLDLQTQALTQLTRHWSIDTEPDWAPDGRSIVFTSDRGGRPQIYQVSTRGGEPKRLTYEGRYNAHPAYSPDGTQLAMVHQDDNGFRIAVLDLETEQLTVLTDGPLDESPSFSANGAMIVYAGNRGGKSVLSTVSVFGRADEVLQQYRHPVREPAWSPR